MYAFVDGQFHAKMLTYLQRCFMKEVYANIRLELCLIEDLVETKTNGDIL